MHDELYRRYAPALLRKARRLLRSGTEAEDVVHTLFCDVLRGEVRQTDFPYLFRATTHRCLNQLRDSRRRVELLQAATDVSAATPTVSAADELELLRQVLNELDPKVSEVVVLHYFDELPQEEVARLVGLSRRTVGKYLGQARDALARRSAQEAT